jgi:secreted trypsin-like serine protease
MSGTRELFANTIMELGNYATHMENECERFGMVWGCKENCPVLEKGQCKCGLYTNIKEYLDWINKQTTEEK